MGTEVIYFSLLFPFSIGRFPRTSTLASRCTSSAPRFTCTCVLWLYVSPLYSFSRVHSGEPLYVSPIRTCVSSGGEPLYMYVSPIRTHGLCGEPLYVSSIGSHMRVVVSRCSSARATLYDLYLIV
eukprot:6411121-Prymnesium_polylepis.1